MGNRIFDIRDKNANRDNIMMPAFELRELFLNSGHEFNTIDYYCDLNEVDFFVFYYLDYYWLWKLIKKGWENKLVYFNGEPEVVEPRNSKEGIEFILSYFKYVMTWNEDFLDNVRVFKRTIPYYFQVNFPEHIWEGRKLLVNISGNKSSAHPKELYSKRRMVIDYFEENNSEDFVLYGQGWSSEGLKTYKGCVDNKTSVYHQFKFALALENMKDVRGYITEKILDCFVSGVVPIYQGADDINQYIPDNCYIKFNDFRNMDDMYAFLKNMDFEEYSQYIENIKQFLSSDAVEKFEPIKQFQCMMNVFKSNSSDIHVKIADKVFLGIRVLYGRLFGILRNIKKTIWKRRQE